MTNQEYVVEKTLSQEDKHVYFSFLFDTNMVELNHKKQKRKLIVLLVASLGMLAYVLYRSITYGFKPVELIMPIALLVLLGAQFFFKRKDNSMYNNFYERFKDKSVQMNYMITPSIIEVFVGQDKESFSYDQISACKLSKMGLFIELKMANKKRVSIISRPGWPYYNEILDLIKEKGIAIKQYEVSND